MTHSLGAQSTWQMRQVTWHPRQGNRAVNSGAQLADSPAHTNNCL